MSEKVVSTSKRGQLDKVDWQKLGRSFLLSLYSGLLTGLYIFFSHIDVSQVKNISYVLVPFIPFVLNVLRRLMADNAKDLGIEEKK